RLSVDQVVSSIRVSCFPAPIRFYSASGGRSSPLVVAHQECVAREVIGQIIKSNLGRRSGAPYRANKAPIHRRRHIPKNVLYPRRQTRTLCIRVLLFWRQRRI